MGTLAKTLYEIDFVEWADRTAELLRQGKLEDVDIEHLLEEVEGLSASQRSAVSSQLSRMLKHLVKQQIRPQQRGKSWIVSINNARASLQDKIQDSPSLRPYAEGILERIYRRAVRDALVETGLKAQKGSLGIPEKSPWSITDLLERDADDLRWE
jgi:Domain of unknown function DUF29